MLATAAVTLPLWASIVIAVVPLVISALALIGGWRQQAATRAQQATEQTTSLEQQRDQLTSNLNHDREQQARMLEHERRQDDLREARGVLDDAARALHEADHRRRDILGDITNPEKREALRLAGLALDQLKERIAIRFGLRHEVTTTFAACANEMVQVFGATKFVELFGLSDRNRRLVGAGERFEALWPAFIDAATAYAGVDLMPRPIERAIS